MSNTLIINARRQLRWQQRLLSDASTFALWSMWLWLCRPVVLSLLGLVGVTLGVSHRPLHPLFPGSAVTLEDAVVSLLGTGGLLMLWNRVSSQPAVRPECGIEPDYAAHFGLEIAQIAKGRDSAVCVVHHDEQGRITRIDSNPPQAQPSATSAAQEYAQAA
jgi:poly-beta-1,6-N-acetyl-D-glucosamine biosynthesis protein PgaD